MCKLAESHIMPGTNQWTAGFNTSRKHTQISIFKIPKVKSGMPEHKNGKKNIWTSTFFFHGTMFLITIMQLDTTAVSMALVFFKKEAFRIATHGKKTLDWLTFKWSYTLWYVQL